MYQQTNCNHSSHFWKFIVKFKYKTARNKFFEDILHKKDKNRWSAKCLLCKKSKRVIDKLGVTSDFTQHARDYHKEEYEQWLNESKQVNSVYTQESSPVCQSYGPDYSRQVDKF